MTEKDWFSLAGRGEASYEEKKSIFLATAEPISSADAAETVLLTAKKKYPDARHHVYAWQLKGQTQLQRHSDDGEPSGTGGIPVLDVLRKNQIDNAIIVVTRYFGGTLLGTGGLVRAYSQAATLAVTAAGICQLRICEQFQIMVSYKHLERLRFCLNQGDFIINRVDFTDEALLWVSSPTDKVKDLYAKVNDLTSGQVRIEKSGEDVVQVDRFSLTELRDRKA